jgi:hypothetical protein
LDTLELKVTLTNDRVGMHVVAHLIVAILGQLNLILYCNLSSDFHQNSNTVFNKLGLNQIEMPSAVILIADGTEEMEL